MLRFDILKYLRVIWDPMGTFVAKQGVIISHWGSVGVIARSLGLNGGSSELRGAQWRSARIVGVSGTQWGSVRNVYTPLF